MQLLALKGLTKNFSGLMAVNNFDLNIEKGEFLGLIGPNGAGKTTLFNIISGFCKPTAGTVTFKEEDITGYRPDKIAARGLVRTFQTATLFNSLRVIENVVIGHHLHTNMNIFKLVLESFSRRQRKETSLQKGSVEILDLMGLTELKYEIVQNLSHGHQRALGVAMSLAAKPELLMLDEPATGMNAKEARTMMSAIREIQQKRGMTVLLVEHNMRVIMEGCDRIAVLNFGKKIADGCPEEIKKNPDVISAYLGAETDAA